MAGRDFFCVTIHPAVVDSWRPRSHGSGDEHHKPGVSPQVAFIVPEPAEREQVLFTQPLRGVARAPLRDRTHKKRPPAGLSKPSIVLHGLPGDGRLGVV